MLVLVVILLTLPLQLLADYTVSDDFEDSLIDSKWKVEIINGAGAVTEHRTGQGEGVLELRLFSLIQFMIQRG